MKHEFQNLRWRLAQRLEQWWWVRYAQNKEPEAYLRFKTQYWQDFLNRLDCSPENFAEPMMDIGCGPAGIFTLFAERRITALDPLLSRYEQKLPFFSRAQYPQVTFCESPLEEAPPGGPYPTVFCLNAINHFRDLEASLDRLRALTAPGGTLLFSIDCHNRRWLKPLFRATQLDLLHPHQYSLAEYTAMLEMRGYRVLRSHTFIRRYSFNYVGLVAHLPKGQPEERRG